MDVIILIKSVGFKYTVEETKVLNDLGNHQENNCNLPGLVTKKSILQPKCVEQKATYGTARHYFHYKGMYYLFMFNCKSCKYFRPHRYKIE